MMGPLKVFNCFALPEPLCCNPDYNGGKGERGINIIPVYICRPANVIVKKKKKKKFEL